MPASDGKMRLTDVADQVQMFRLIQSIPSPKAEPFKVWMAQVASERIDEIQDPELAIDRGIEYYRMKGYGEGWIAERMKGQEYEARGDCASVWECELKKERRGFTLPYLAEQIRRNGASYASEQAQRRERNAEHRAMLKAAQERYESTISPRTHR